MIGSRTLLRYRCRLVFSFGKSKILSAPASKRRCPIFLCNIVPVEPPAKVSMAKFNVSVNHEVQREVAVTKLKGFSDRM